MSQDRIAVIGGARTPFARARTAYAKMSAAQLGGIAMKEAVSLSGVSPAMVEEIHYGIVSAPAEGSNIAREALFDSGLPASIPCTGVNQYCASALEAVVGIAAKISAGRIECGLAGGVESISSVRALFSLEATNYFQDLAKAKTLGQRLAFLSKFKGAFLAPRAPGIKEPTTGLTMGQSADLMSRHFQVRRPEQDQFALESHQKASKAWADGFFNSHVCKVGTPDGKVIDRDTDVRSDSSLEKLAKLKPVFYKDGTITAGNASPLTDGASAVILMRESKAKSLGLNPIGYIKSSAVAAVDIQNEPLLIGPAYAIPKALKLAGISWSDLDLYEIHEAFAGQVLATLRAIESPEFAKEKLGLSAPIGKIDSEKLNPNGGSIAMGHPFGATGGRLVLQTLHQLKKSGKKYGLISVCAAGGLGAVMILETE